MPADVLIVLIIMLVCVIVCTCCLVIDTAIKWGEYVSAKNYPGGGI